MTQMLAFASTTVKYSPIYRAIYNQRRENYITKVQSCISSMVFVNISRLNRAVSPQCILSQPLLTFPTLISMQLEMHGAFALFPTKLSRFGDRGASSTDYDNKKCFGDNRGRERESTSACIAGRRRFLSITRVHFRNRRTRRTGGAFRMGSASPPPPPTFGANSETCPCIAKGGGGT